MNLPFSAGSPFLAVAAFPIVSKRIRKLHKREKLLLFIDIYHLLRIQLVSTVHELKTKFLLSSNLQSEFYATLLTIQIIIK